MATARAQSLRVRHCAPTRDERSRTDGTEKSQEQHQRGTKTSRTMADPTATATATPPTPNHPEVNTLVAPELGEEIHYGTVGRSYKRLKIAETATMLGRATTSDLGEEVAHHHSVVQGISRPAWLTDFKNELKNELKNEFFNPLMASNARIENRPIREANRVMLEHGKTALLPRVEHSGGPVAIRRVPTMTDFQTNYDFELSSTVINQMETAALDKFYTLYRAPELRGIVGRSLQNRRENLLKFLTGP